MKIKKSNRLCEIIIKLAKLTKLGLNRPRQ